MANVTKTVTHSVEQHSDEHGLWTRAVPREVFASASGGLICPFWKISITQSRRWLRSSGGHSASTETEDGEPA